MTQTPDILRAHALGIALDAPLPLQAAEQTEYLRAYDAGQRDANALYELQLASIHARHRADMRLACAVAVALAALAVFASWIVWGRG